MVKELATYSFAVVMASLSLSPVYVLPERITCGKILELEGSLRRFKLQVTQSIQEARLIVAQVSSPQRAAFELRRKGLWTKQCLPMDESHGKQPGRTIIKEETLDTVGRIIKRRKLESKELKEEQDLLLSSQSNPIVLDDSQTASEEEGLKSSHREGVESSITGRYSENLAADDTLSNLVILVRPDWMDDSSRSGELRAYNNYEVYRGYRTEKPSKEPGDTTANPRTATKRTRSSPSNTTSQPGTISNAQEARYHHPKLLARTTSEFELQHIPPAPDWVKKGIRWSCQRVTPRISPNAPFIEQLKQIRLARELQDDEIGIRAYSTKIASIAAYPHRLTQREEILRLPGCNEKTANLWSEWEASGATDDQRQILEVALNDEDPEQQSLRLFYSIWGVGAKTARAFYHDRAWRNLDDVIEHGWSTLSRAQRIGLKYHEEFLEKMPRADIEAIAARVLTCARAVRDERVQMCIVGGYRRGQDLSTDCDIILTHPDERQTLGLVEDLVVRLEDEGCVTHTLMLSTHSSRNQQAVRPLHPQNLPAASLGHGFGKQEHSGASRRSFDTLDKALLVYQDPSFPNRDAALRSAVEQGLPVANPNPHRRLDVVISGWRTVGCAIVGWSGATTFERDLRRYAEVERGWRFDSGGVRDRRTGEVVDLEGEDLARGWGVKTSWEEGERRVFEGLGLEWLEPEERCTG